MKINASLVRLSAACLLLGIAGCKQEHLNGVKSDPAVKVYLPDSEKPNGLVDVMAGNSLKVDSAASTVNFSIPVYRGGESNFETLTVDVSADNSAIAGLITAGTLPANTVILDPADYTLDAKDTVALNNNIMKGKITPKIKIASLDKYAGKVAALGIKISNASKREVNADMSKAIIYFSVEDLIDAITPKTNMIDNTKWQIYHRGDGVTFTVNADGSVLATGGNWGQQGIVQAVEVRANKSYKIDMNVAGSGASDCWFEVYVGQAVPSEADDYKDGDTRIALNTWNGCGKSPFNGLLSSLSCAGKGNVVSFPTAGKAYVLIRSGGSSLGTKGIKITNIDFRRVD
ncbi:DUF1735 domain-containing protein [Mucilaginibacter sp. SMC90]|uniref:DUF1735 domain-containing protein n=1 Tax=Mucilaginibacter sp. SMC90 TaxID=2929803 RepID=UPI001FB404E3|nr:DUF1735 domain-containing protein [Mucilaginibacter sp. SMC90]UOE51078.1 DUF1735 domain-containing protein [Mucilaginibacter sp. SMC90]